MWLYLLIIKYQKKKIKNKIKKNTKNYNVKKHS
jgi:hypothetical protein